MSSAHSADPRDPRGFYRSLGVAPDASEAELGRAYRRAAKRWHPDRNASPEARRRMAEINEAWETLGDPARHADYDRGAGAYAGGPGHPDGGPTDTAAPPRPVVAPAVVRFGRLKVGERRSQTILVGNAGGPPSTVQIDPPAGDWFQVVAARGTDIPDVVAEFDIEAVAAPPRGHRAATITISLDDAVATVALEAEVAGSVAAPAGDGAPAGFDVGGYGMADPVSAGTGLPVAPYPVRVLEEIPLWQRLAYALVGAGMPPAVLAYSLSPGSTVAPEQRPILVALVLGLVGIALVAALTTAFWTRVASAGVPGRWAALLTVWVGQAAVWLSTVVAVLVVVGIVVGLVFVAFMVFALLGALFGDS